MAPGHILQTIKHNMLLSGQIVHMEKSKLTKSPALCEHGTAVKHVF